MSFEELIVTKVPDYGPLRFIDYMLESAGFLRAGMFRIKPANRKELPAVYDPVSQHTFHEPIFREPDMMVIRSYAFCPLPIERILDAIASCDEVPVGADITWTFHPNKPNDDGVVTSTKQWVKGDDHDIDVFVPTESADADTPDAIDESAEEVDGEGF